jgi:hypothetical protein
VSALKACVSAVRDNPLQTPDTSDTAGNDHWIKKDKGHPSCLLQALERGSKTIALDDVREGIRWEYVKERRVRRPMNMTARISR